jgi:hypothetical protein
MLKRVANDRFLQGAKYKSNTKSNFIVISTKNEEKSLTPETDFSVVPPSK